MDLSKDDIKLAEDMVVVFYNKVKKLVELEHIEKEKYAEIFSLIIKNMVLCACVSIRGGIEKQVSYWEEIRNDVDLHIKDFINLAEKQIKELGD